ncbi:MAG: carboxypeptidase-like regulatory domain-containing protein, partial [Prevotella sp.]|nr:carboxypeptidase-like regulatory domain-containing protein [Prevotella sp.]
MRKQLFSVMLCLGAIGGVSLCPMPVQASVAQATITVKGQVVDENGEPLIGATVRLKDATTGVITDFDGNFTISAKSNAVIVVSYMGYKTREIAVRGRAVLEPIKLESDTNVLDQVVVVGYGVQKKADLTGSVSIVNADELKKVSNSNISTMLEG